MKFSKNWSKLFWGTFTTIRKYGDYYKLGYAYPIETPTKTFYAEVVSTRRIKKEDITETIALRDADMSRDDLIKLLERFYGAEFNDFILVTLMSIDKEKKDEIQKETSSN